MLIRNVKTFTPQEFEKYLSTHDIFEKIVQTSAGKLHIKATHDGMFQASFLEHDLKLSDVSIKLDTVLLVGTPFQLRVWQQLLKIQSGSTCTYQQLAHLIERPHAHRAVANALGANKIAYFVPCHRVKRTDGTLGGFAWGIERKQALLNAEKLA